MVEVKQWLHNWTMDVEETMNTTMVEPLKVQICLYSIIRTHPYSLLSLAAQAAHPDVSEALSF